MTGTYVRILLAVLGLALMAHPVGSQVNEQDRLNRCQNNRDALARLQTELAGMWSDNHFGQARSVLRALEQRDAYIQQRSLGIMRNSEEIERCKAPQYARSASGWCSPDNIETMQSNIVNLTAQNEALLAEKRQIAASIGMNCAGAQLGCDFYMTQNLREAISAAEANRPRRDQIAAQMEMHRTNLIALQCDRPANGYALADPLGTRWSESEGGWSGDWVRRGTSNVFNASWGGGSIRAVLTISISGNQVSVSRQNATDGNNCQYQGTLNGSQVSGTYTCTSGGGNWSATIH